ncbi:hypothetical protein A6M27_20825 [Acidithiobacillus thiooxidans]|nr:hypothetical protein A6M27_20825 [Acidithiobacillus thiooxidans]
MYLDADQHRAFLQCRASRLLHDKNQIQADKMADIWIQQLLAADLGIASRAIVLGKDAVIHSTQPIANASDILKELLDFWGESLLQPLPVTLKTAVAALQNTNPAVIYEGNQHSDGEVQRYPGLARDYPDFARLSSQRCGPRQWGFQEYAEALYRPFADWLEKLEVEPHA